MRILFAIPLLLLGACQVSKDDNNGTTSVTYNSDVAENAAADIGNTAAEHRRGHRQRRAKRPATRSRTRSTTRDVDVNVNADVKTENTAMDA